MPRSSTFRRFSAVPALLLGLSIVLAHPAPSALAESYPSDRPAEPAKSGAVSKVKTKSKETWADMKARWARQKERWADCQKREKEQKRSATATREFLEDCMTKQ